MATLILPPRYTNDSRILWKASIALGWEVLRLQEWRINRDQVSGDVIIYGEALFVKTIADQLDLCLIEPTAEWVISLPTEYLKRDVGLVRASEIGSISFPAFIKPFAEKSLPPRVYQSLQDFILPEYVSEDEQLFYSDPVVWEVEYRSFVLNDECLTISLYERNGKVNQSEDGNWPASVEEIDEAHRFVQGILEEFPDQIPPAMVLDVGIIQDKGWAVLEVNPCWGSGIYGCDPFEVLKTIQRACINRNQIEEDDLMWVSSL